MLLPILIAGSLFFSTIVVFAMVRHYRRACSSAGWPQVAGKLLECEVLSRPADEGPGDVYDLHVRYAYEIAGVEYQSQTIAFYFGRWGSERMAYDNLRHRLTATDSLTVYANPRDPREAVLLPGGNQNSRGVLVVLSVLAYVGPLCGLTAIYFLIRDW